MSQAPVEEVIGVLEALRTARCEQLEQRYRQALDVCRQERGAEFLRTVDEDWLDEQRLPFATRPAWPALDSWDEGGTYWAIEHELRPALIEHVQAHRSVLVADEPQ